MRKSLEWMDQGVCVNGGHNPDLWAPDPGDDQGIQEAIDLCNTCPVKALCAADAETRGIRDGVRGGVWRGGARQARRKAAADARKAAKVLAGSGVSG